ncbi:MAG: ribonuclease Y [Candidatus Eisenbacteria bacterium]|nr:ribonuclease Y [Candidatus Eisenbacteria bacterium]
MQTGWLIPVLVAAIAAALAYALGFWMHRRIGQARLRDAEGESRRLLEEARKEAELTKKTAEVEAREEWFRAKAKFDAEMWEVRQELGKREQEIGDRETQLKRQTDQLQNRERELKRLEGQLSEREQQTEQRSVELERVLAEQNARLEQISGLTAEAAREQLLRNMEDEARADAARLARRIREEAERNAEREARRILTIAIQRLAAEQSVESTVTVVSLPNEEMKGRIIGREGRNIRAFETATGVDVIIDDTPEAVLLSGYDPVRREVARLALERLISDGRIHPGRIEEIVEKEGREVQREIRETGEGVALDLGAHGLHPELVRHLGALTYRTSFGQNVLKHSIEVARLAAMMAAELGLDAELAKRAGLLHDIGKAVDHEVEGPHAQIGMELAKRCHERDEICEAIGAHHGEMETDSVYAFLVQAGDAVSGARPGARRETLEAYIKRLERLETLAESFAGVERCFAIQAGREIRIMVQQKQVDDARAGDLAGEVARKIEKELQYPGQIKVVVIRETRAIEYAR